jgi:lysozyme
VTYPDGTKVKPGDRVTQPEAESHLQHNVNRVFVRGVNDALGSTSVSQNQFDALVSFAYNLGLGSLNSSTLLKKIEANPDDPAIREEMAKWVHVKGKKVQGLVCRRKREADVYFSKS